MKLILNNPFTIEIPADGKEDEVLTGTIRDFTKQEKADFKKAFKKNADKSKNIQRKLKELKRLNEKIEKDTESLNSEDILENAAKERFEICVQSKDDTRLQELSDQVGYVALLEVMVKDVAEKKQNATPSS